MVCMGFKAGAIDEKMLDPKFVFEDIKDVVGSGENADASTTINSIKKLIDTKKKLSEVTEKYSDLKRRARHYKAHCQSKQVRKFLNQREKILAALNREERLKANTSHLKRDKGSPQNKKKVLKNP